jgi:dihydroxyacetone kinase-like predicted kinase
MMVYINEELKAAKAVINSLSTTPLLKSVFLAALNKANHAAILNLSSGGALNEARGNVGIALSNLTYGPRTPEKIDSKRRSAPTLPHAS